MVPGPRPDALPGDEEREEDLEPPAPDPAASEDVKVGDIAIVPFARLREQLGCGPEAGIIVEDRRHLVKLFFPGMDRVFWLEHERVRSVPLGRLPVHPLVERLHRLSTILGADLIEIYDQAGDVAVYHIGFRGTDLDGLHAVRDLLGDDLRRMRIEPGSMRRVKLNLAFRMPS
ncbi:MAG: hypothetical protein ACKOSS_00610 [Planctomycetia bacterium]